MNNILFVTHDISTGGASRSLQGLLSYKQKNINAFLLVNIIDTTLFKISRAELSKKFNIEEKNIIFGFIPFNYCYEFGETGLSLRRRISSTIRYTLWLLYEPFYKVLLKQKNINIVHLSDLCLNQMIKSFHNTFIHVRSLLVRNKKQVYENLTQSSGLVFIDEITKHICFETGQHKSIVLCNPYNQSNVPERPDELLIKHRTINISEKSIFVYAGQINFPLKGVGFIVDAFKKCKDDTMVLLLYGKAFGRSEADLLKEIDNESGIYYLGEENNLTNIYKYCDVIIRGEDKFSLGRTVFEGLFSGSLALIPGSEKDVSNTTELKVFSNQVIVYKPRNKDNFIEGIIKCKGYKRITGDYTNNIKAYTQDFYHFIGAE